MHTFTYTDIHVHTCTYRNIHLIYIHIHNLHTHTCTIRLIHTHEHIHIHIHSLHNNPCHYHPAKIFIFEMFLAFKNKIQTTDLLHILTHAKVLSCRP